jgi:HK97 family phage prohead protease
MPIPKPKKEEKKNEFVSRCVSKLSQDEEFETNEQRIAVCNRQWKQSKTKEVNTVKALGKAYAKYKDGKANAPVLKMEGQLQSEDGQIKGILTKEIEDRDGEVIAVDGIKLDNYLKNPVLIDAHNMTGSVIENLLGKVVNIRKEEDMDGCKSLVGDLEFAPTPRGETAKKLAEAGFGKTLSIGFKVTDYDPKKRRVKESELYETSMVMVPSNTEAMIEKVKSIKSNNKDYASVSDIAKKLALLDNIHPKIKLYRKYFMDKGLCDKLEYKKTGKEAVDIKRVSEKVHALLQKEETPQKQTETPKRITKKEAGMIVDTVLSSLTDYDLKSE